MRIPPSVQWVAIKKNGGCAKIFRKPSEKKWGSLTILDCRRVAVASEPAMASEETTVSTSRIVMLRYFNLFFKLCIIVCGESLDFPLFIGVECNIRVPSNLAAVKKNVYCFYWHYTYVTVGGGPARTGWRAAPGEFISQREIGSRSPRFYSRICRKLPSRLKKSLLLRGGSVKWIF